MTASLRIGVLGVGNILMGDDGIGPFVVRILEARYEFPPNVVLHDLGTLRRLRRDHFDRFCQRQSAGGRNKAFPQT